MLNSLPLVSSVFVLALGLLVWLKNRTEKLNIVFSLNCLAMAVWFFCTYRMFNSFGANWIIFWERLAYVGVVFIPTLMYHLALVFTKNEKQGRRSLYLSYFLSFIFLILSRTPFFLNGIYYYGATVHAKAQIFHHIFVACIFLFLIFFFRIFYSYYKKCASPIVKNQTKYIIVAFYVFSFSIINFLAAYGIEVSPAFYLLGVAFSLICGYAVVRYRLLSPRFVVSRSVIYFFLVLFVAVAFSFLTLLVSGDYLPQMNYAERLTLTLAVALLIVLSLEPLKVFLASVTDKVFFKNAIDYDEVLNNLAHLVGEELDLKKLTTKLKEATCRQLRLKDFKIFLYQDKKNKFGYAPGERQTGYLELRGGAAMAEYFKLKPQAVVVEELEHALKSKNNLITKEELKIAAAAVGEMEKFKAEAISPVLKEGKLTAVFAGYAKLSGDAYHVKDLNTLNVLGTQFASALEKAQLYDEAQEFGQKLKKEVERATKELREANEHLKELDRAKTEFISIASHQLRTPLSGVKGYLSMLLEGDFGKLSEEQHKVVLNILNNSDRMVRLVNIFLNISRIESGRLKLEKTKFDLANLLKEVVAQIKTEADEKNLILVFKEDAPKVELWADRDKVYDVILNLLDNAVKYTPAGKINVGMKLVGKNKVEVMVYDTGIGIPPEELDELFTKFRRGKKIAQINTTGAGLGLFIAKKIVELHHGEIWARSKGESKGSEFGFSLPLKSTNKK